jgi:Zn-dependent protease/predicted transcriptional regulator
MRTGIRLDKIFNIEIFLDYSWIVVFVLVVWIFAVFYLPSRLTGIGVFTRIWLAVLISVLFFASALAHELMHSYVAVKNKIKVNRIILFLFGGMSELFEEPNTPEKEFKIAIAGPATSLALAVIFAFLWSMLAKYSHSEILIVIASVLFQVNIILAMFNLLPGFPLDGGRILRSVYWAATSDFKKSTLIATTGGQLVAIFLIVLGILQVIITGLWSGVWLILIGLFLNQAAGQSYMELEIKEKLENKKVADFINKNIICLNPRLSIEDALAEYFLFYASMSFPVVDDDKVVGIIALKDIRKTIKHVPDNAHVGDIMRLFPAKLSTELNESVLSSLKKMIERDVAFLPVMQENKIVGMITLESISKYLSEGHVE